MDVAEFTRLSRLLDEASEHEAKLRAEIVKKATSDGTFVLSRSWMWEVWREASARRREAEDALLEFERRGGARLG